MSSLCNYSDANILVKEAMTVTAPNNANKLVIFKNCAPFTNSISRIKNTQVVVAHDIDVTKSMYGLIGYSTNDSKTTEILL